MKTNRFKRLWGAAPTSCRTASGGGLGDETAASPDQGCFELVLSYIYPVISKKSFK